MIVTVIFLPLMILRQIQPCVGCARCLFVESVLIGLSKHESFDAMSLKTSPIDGNLDSYWIFIEVCSVPCCELRLSGKSFLVSKFVIFKNDFRVWRLGSCGLRRVWNIFLITCLLESPHFIWFFESGSQCLLMKKWDTFIIFWSRFGCTFYTHTVWFWPTQSVSCPWEPDAWNWQAMFAQQFDRGLD